jgi:SMI1 / KNR4 family (SUKH-1)
MADSEQIVGELRRIIETYGYRTFGPVSEERIRAAEQELGLVFPLSYRLYLREFGAVGDILDLYIYGLADTRDTDKEMPWFFNVIDKTLFWRDRYDCLESEKFEPLKPYLIDVGPHGGGGCWFFLDTSAMDEAGEAPVLIHGHGMPLQVFAPSFIEFLRKFADDVDPFSHIIKDPPKSRPVPVDPEPVEKPEPRSIAWLEADPETFALDKPPIARHFGVDEASRDVFVHAQTVGLSLQHQLEAMTVGQGFFANPTNLQGFGEPFVAIDYLVIHHPELAETVRLAELGRWVLDAFDQASSENSEGE